MSHGQVPGFSRDESARHHLDQRRLPTPINHLTSLRPQAPGRPCARALPLMTHRSDVSSGPISFSASHDYSNYSHSPVPGPSASWALPMGIQRTLISAGSISVTPPHPSLNSSQPPVLRSSTSGTPLVPFAHGSAVPVPQPRQAHHSNSARPWGLEVSTISKSWSSEASRSQGSSVPMGQPAFDYYHHTFPQPNLMSQAPRGIKRKAQTLSSPANISYFQNTFRSSSITSGYTSSNHDGDSGEHLPSLIGRATSDAATFTASSSSPEVELNIILEDPENGQLYREKRIRTQEELDSQKEGMRVLKDNGGACEACYKSKKRCGPGEPCPPCASRHRECVRVLRNDGETVSAGGHPTSGSALAQPISTSSQCVSTSRQSFLSHTETVSAPTRSHSPRIGRETLTPTQDSLIDRPSRPEHLPTEQTSLTDRPGHPENVATETTLNEDPTSLDCNLLDGYIDPFSVESWEDGMNCIDSAYGNVSYSWVGPDAGGHLKL